MSAFLKKQNEIFSSHKLTNYFVLAAARGRAVAASTPGVSRPLQVTNQVKIIQFSRKYFTSYKTTGDVFILAGRNGNVALRDFWRYKPGQSGDNVDKVDIKLFFLPSGLVIDVSRLVPAF